MDAMLIQVAGLEARDAAGAQALMVWLLPACIIFVIACIANVACGGFGGGPDGDDSDGGCGGE